MSNPTELPDLDRGYFKRKLTTIVRDLSSYTAQEMARELVRLAKVADEIEVVKEARRAQPEGEAPQAEPVAWMLDFGDERVVTADRKEMEAWVTQHDNPYTPIPLGPITAPAAQHAESGAQAARHPQGSFAEFMQPNVDDLAHSLAAQSQGAPDNRANWCKECVGQGIDTDPPEPGEDGICRACAGSGLAAQQAAAPGALALLNVDEMAALRRFDETCQDGEGYDVPKEMMQRLAAIGVVRRTSGSIYEQTSFGLHALGQPAPSAPGTPEAPADKHLPGWERGIATVTLIGHQLREALDFINPDGDDDVDQRDDWLTFGIVQHADDEGKVTTGLCCWNDDTDGVLPLDGETRAAQLDGGRGENHA